ncbi:hypothetical protein CA85_39390 [Allorhodopirellula solitaria]|uniref:Uncharacterized protein n=1 Tax=Allorhodopirellula solitaria TaxID=2527987 RepID=A0A5C5XAA9_9BACT|nr:hypothetical protein CA85_39390 [Allorhodopirellula solitaria]
MLSYRKTICGEALRHHAVCNPLSEEGGFGRNGRNETTKPIKATNKRNRVLKTNIRSPAPKVAVTPSARPSCSYGVHSHMSGKSLPQKIPIQRVRSSTIDS